MGLSAAEEVQVEAAYEYQYQDSEQQLIVAGVVCKQQDDNDQENDIVLL